MRPSPSIKPLSHCQRSGSSRLERRFPFLRRVLVATWFVRHITAWCGACAVPLPTNGCVDERSNFLLGRCLALPRKCADHPGRGSPFHCSGLMNAPLPTPQRASFVQVLGAAFSDRLYFKRVLGHNLAAELESEQIASAHSSGWWAATPGAERALMLARADLSKLRRSLRTSGLFALALAGIALVVAAALGKVHPSLPADYGKLVTSIGVAFGAWGAFLQFHPARVSWRGTLLHEVIHAVAVRVLAGGGVVLAALGALWWQ
jgi:hypothetical protein